MIRRAEEVLISIACASLGGLMALANHEPPWAAILTSVLVLVGCLRWDDWIKRPIVAVFGGVAAALAGLVNAMRWPRG